ncbi:MAG: CehA/McbA family metallohydrolase [Aggregatilineales bacterium]
MFKENLLQEDHFSFTVARSINGKSAVEPDLCLTETGGWLIWVQQSFTGDSVYARSFTDEGFGDILQWSDAIGVEYQPTITTLPDGTILGIHAAKREGVYHLIARTYSGDTLSAETIIYQNSDGIFRPRVLVVNQTVWLVFEITDVNATRVMMTTCATNTLDAWQLAEAINGASSWCSRTALASTPDHAVWCAYDSYDGEQYDVYLQRLDSLAEPIKISNGDYQSVQPALTADDEGKLWIAYASNVDIARRDRWWLTKWNVIRCFDGNTVYDIPTQPEHDVYNEDSFQGWEFPALIAEPAGRLWLLGQSAHTLYMASCETFGWSELYNISEKHWASWKPRIRVAGNNPYYVVSMGLDGAQLQKLDVNDSATAPPLLNTHLPVPAANHSVDRPHPNLKTADGDMLNYYFGDLHCHSIYGDATSDVDEIYHRYRDAYGYDFATLTEHDYLDGITLSQAEMNMLWNCARRLSEPGKFIAMYGYEWTSPAIAEHVTEGATVGEGHRHVVYPDDRGELVNYGDPTANTGAKLLHRLKGRRALVIPHHTSWSGTDWDAHDPELQRVVEICSTHGRFEYSGNLPIGYRRDHIHPHKFVLDALERGYRLGFVGGSDSHGLRWHATEPEGRDSFVPAGTRVGWKEDPYRTGMTVVLAPELTREAIFDGIYQRHCYATTGEFIVIDFRVNGALMGSEISSPDSPHITVSVQGSAPLHSVEVIRSGQVFSSVHLGADQNISTMQFEFDDHIIIPQETHYYYLRVLQTDGNMAWSSPIWVTFERNGS